MNERSEQRVAVVTGTRADFGLLAPVMRAIQSEPTLELITICAGAHFLQPTNTWTEVAARFSIDARIEMQVKRHTGRLADARALGRGVISIVDAFERLRPQWVVVLGDRIEAFAAASAASVGGIALAHIHGGDRAEGVADESMRHAMSKLAHLHLTATQRSADRLVQMGEDPRRIIVVGSPAVSGLIEVKPLEDEQYVSLGSPSIIVLVHPTGSSDEEDGRTAIAIAEATQEESTLWLHPNHDPGREAIVRIINSICQRPRTRVIDHLEHRQFRRLVRRVAAGGGVVVGNSSAGLIECAAFQCPVVDVGPRQGGRERPDNVVHIEDPTAQAVRDAIRAARSADLHEMTHPYGPGDAPMRIVQAILAQNPADPALIRKRCTY